MADMIFTRTLTDNRFTLTVDITNLTSGELSTIQDFGEPFVKFGGVIDVADTSLFHIGYVPISPSSFSVQETTRTMPSGFPYSITLDADLISTAKANLTDLQNHIDNVLTNAWTALKANSDTWTVGSPETILLP